MKQLIGLNIMAFAIFVTIIMIMYNGTTKEKISIIIAEPILMALASFGAWLMTN